MAYVKNFIIFAILANFGTETRVTELTFFNSFLNVIYQFFAPVAIALACSIILNRMISTKKITRNSEDSDTDDDEHSQESLEHNQMILFLLCPIFAFLLTECSETSGNLSLFVVGLFQGLYTQFNLNPNARSSLKWVITLIVQ
jgi:NhaP-type Na+/H+ or K+/H+ antiporter